MRIKQLFIIIFIAIGSNAFASNTVIKGNSKLFKGNEISFYTYSDYISNQKIKLGYTNIDQNGAYSFDFEATEVKKLFLKIEDKTTWFFAKPGEIYNIDISYNEDFNKGRIYDKELSLFFNFPVPTELNQQIKKFNQQFDDFIADNEILLKKRDRSVEPKLAAFKIKMLKEAESANSDFVKTFIKYSIASTENSLDVSYKKNTAGKNSLNTKANLYLEYLDNKPIAYLNPEYIGFFKAFFKNELKKLTLQLSGTDINAAINDNNSYTALSKALSKYPFLQNDEFKNLFILNGLLEISKDKYFTQKNILSILTEIKNNSKYPEQKIIAQNIIEKITEKKFGPGSIAPNFSLKDKNNELIDLEKFKGKPIYINFWTTWSIPSQKEMKILETLHKKYKNKVEFISICADNDYKKMTTFLLKNTAYQWTFLHIGNDKKILEKYNIVTYPIYILIDENLKILKAPAPRPGGTAERATEENIDQDLYELTKSR
jgi:thiol-disulfide isomerase/thioredoxin